MHLRMQITQKSGIKFQGIRREVSEPWRVLATSLGLPREGWPSAWSDGSGSREEEIQSLWGVTFSACAWHSTVASRRWPCTSWDGRCISLCPLLMPEQGDDTVGADTGFLVRQGAGGPFLNASHTCPEQHREEVPLLPQSHPQEPARRGGG